MKPMKNKDIIYLSFIICCFAIGKFIPLGDVTLYAVVCGFFIEYFGHFKMFALYSIPNLIGLVELPILQSWLDNWVNQVTPALVDFMKANTKIITHHTLHFNLYPKLTPGINQFYTYAPTQPTDTLNSIYFMGSWMGTLMLVGLVFVYGFIILTVIHRLFKNIGVYRRVVF